MRFEKIGNKRGPNVMIKSVLEVHWSINNFRAKMLCAIHSNCGNDFGTYIRHQQVLCLSCHSHCSL